MVAFAVVGAVAGGLSLATGQSQNFDVFAQASRDLLVPVNMYEKHASEYFKYSPTFALLWLPFAVLPAWFSAPAWSVLNLVVAYAGISAMFESERDKRVALTVSLAGMLLTLDGDQTNPLVVGLFFLALRAYENSQSKLGAALTSAGVFIKIFPLVGVVFALRGPRKMAHAVWLGVAGVVGVLLPLAVLSPTELLQQYAWWRQLLARDSSNRGWSLMHAINDFGIDVAPKSMQLAGIVLLAGVALVYFVVDTSFAWRRTFACFMLVWCILFNHRTESPTMVISAAATGVWFAATPRHALKGALVALSIVAPGPFFARPEETWTHGFGFLAAHRLFHPLRMVPLTLIAGWMAVELLRPVLRKGESRPN